MYSFEVTDYGFMFISNGFFSLEVAKAWNADFHKTLEKVVQIGRPFGQFADLRGFKPGPPESQAYITESMKAFKKAGGRRAIVLFDTHLATMHIKRLAKESGIYEWERYIDAETFPNFEKVVLAWLNEGADPDFIKK